MEFPCARFGSPCFAVIFSSKLQSENGVVPDGYEAMANQMIALAEKVEGYLGIESVRDSATCGITVSYWRTTEAIQTWRENVEHQVAQKMGREKWYRSYEVRICQVIREYGSP